jgi:hypothetical protein
MILCILCLFSCTALRSDGNMMLYIYYTICICGNIIVYATKHYQVISENVKLCVQHSSINILKINIHIYSLNCEPGSNFRFTKLLSCLIPTVQSSYYSKQQVTEAFTLFTWPYTSIYSRLIWFNLALFNLT